MKITKCTGEGQGSCKRCSDKGKWNRTWCCFLYKIEGLEGCYCSDCAIPTPTLRRSLSSNAREPLSEKKPLVWVSRCEKHKLSESD